MKFTLKEKFLAFLGLGVFILLWIKQKTWDKVVNKL